MRHKIKRFYHKYLNLRNKWKISSKLILVERVELADDRGHYQAGIWQIWEKRWNAWKIVFESGECEKAEIIASIRHEDWLYGIRRRWLEGLTQGEQDYYVRM